MIDINEIKKDLYKSKVMAIFSHYSDGKLFYTVEALGTEFMFPIYVTEMYTKTFTSGDVTIETHNTIRLSTDLGSTNFGNKIKGSDLNRWIIKAVDNNEFIQIRV